MPFTMGSLVSGPARRRLLLYGLPLMTVAAVFVAVFFQPHKLFLDDRVDEAAPVGRIAGGQSSPGSTSTAAPVDGNTAEPAGSSATKQPDVAAPASAPPVIIASGRFRGLEHSTTGRSVVTELPDGSRVLRFEDLETSNGPDLRVYLSAGSNDANFGAEYGNDFVELGRLKGNLGNQNYEIPPGVDLAHYRNAVIWCARFSVGFGVATLG